ncbi:MAG: HAD-IA family hydrolase [Dehalococcoidia bacterium]|nr:HAD-IA family hydrolase [Dehalococcoidia bacterium]
MIRAVFFDLYNTVARFDPPREELQVAVCREMGMTVTAEGIERGYVRADDYLARENGRDPVFKRPNERLAAFWAEYERLVLEGAGVNASLELSGEIFARVRRQHYDLALFDDVLPAMFVLRQRALVLGLLSNINRDIRQLTDALRLTPYLDFAITPAEAGAEKPHPPIFLEALRRADCAPAEALHVGDQYHSDVVGARGVGIKPLLLDRTGLLDPAQYDVPVIRSLMEVQDHLGEPGPESLPE